MSNEIVYALDFDGVICDSAIETGISGWKAACQIWPDMSGDAPYELVESFRQIRPIIETGFEAILTMRALYTGASMQSLYQNHADIFKQLMQSAQISSDDLKALFGETRDRWIAEDKSLWVLKNPLYVGIAEKLAQLNANDNWYVVTTKQERFVQMILAANHIELPAERIYGLDRNMSKVAVLQMLQQRHPGKILHFYEDRLPTLEKVKQTPELAAVQLFFASWGYNDANDKQQAQAQEFKLLELADFLSA